MLYAFALRGLLADEALARVLRDAGLDREGATLTQIRDALPLDSLPSEYTRPALAMAVVYAAVAAFENHARVLVQNVLITTYGDAWWETGFPKKTRTRAERRAEEEAETRWHGQRGDNPIMYTSLADLASVIANPDHRDAFEPHVRSSEWVAAVFDVVERSRNVIMHSGTLEQADIDRLGMSIRDWLAQVGT